MAGLGKKTFVAGDVLTAADVNGYLMEQAVMVFASSAARGSAIAAPAEGMTTYLSDSNAVESYTGSAWQPVANHPGTVTVGGVTTTGVVTAGSVASSGGITGTNITGSGLITGATLSISGASVNMAGASANVGSTTADAGWNGTVLRAKSSMQELKRDIATVCGDLVGVDEHRLAGASDVDPADVLDLAVVDFRWIENDRRDFGFIAEDVAAKFPFGVGRNDDGKPISVRDTPILAALLAVVRRQQDTITDLVARIEALEA